jgi:hypothetical protein
MFRRLASLGFPKKLLLASSAFYNTTTARLRIGVLLTSAFLINSGVSEGRVLSPMLFSLAFSIIWEKLRTSPFPDNEYTFRAEDFWLIAYADDLVLLASSLQKANEVLSQLMEILKVFDLEFSAVKSEGIVFTPGGRCGSFDILSSNLHLGEESLKIVGAFKYLGVWLEPSLKYGQHLAMVEERARLATLETVKLVNELDIREPHRFSILYRSFVESQLYGMELFPACAVPTINRVRRHFWASIYSLPADMSSCLSDFFLCLPPAELTILKARWNFGTRLGAHAIPAVHKALELEDRVKRRSVGWSHENFIVARHIHPTLRSDFSFAEFSVNLFSCFPNLDNLNYSVIVREAEENPALTFFTFLTSFHQASALRGALGRLSFEHARLVLLFLFSGLRWRISRIALKTCPFCPRFELLWSHFLECECALPMLSAEFLGMELLLRYAQANRWRDVFAMIGEVILIWCDLLSTCVLDIDIVQSLAHLP